MRSRLGDSGAINLTAITFALDDTSRFLLGTEGGAVLVCSSLLMVGKSAGTYPQGEVRFLVSVRHLSMKGRLDRVPGHLFPLLRLIFYFLFKL